MTGKPSSELQLASYGSPLHRPVIGWALSLLLAALTIFAVTQLAGILDPTKPARLGVFLLALAVCGVITLIPVALLRWLDRREPEPWVVLLLAFLWGALIATGISSEVNGIVDAAIGEMLGAILTGPIIEEIAKGLGLLVFLLLLRSEFDGPRDGFVYGVLIGLGFTWLETAVYIATGFEESGSIAWGFQLSSRYALAGLNGHALYTGITGTFIGFSLLRKGWLSKIGLVAAGFLLAIFNHLLWNSLGTILSGPFAGIIGTVFVGQEAVDLLSAGDLSVMPLWVSWPANVAALLIANALGYLIILAGLVRSGRWERAVMIEQLRDEVGTSSVSAAEYANIQGRCEPPKTPQVARHIFTTQCNLAKRKFYLQHHQQSFDADPVVTARRSQLQQLRSASA
ncbi:MAG: hypothetical protein Kow0031_14020 [Anaerolineae bacterium]